MSPSRKVYALKRIRLTGLDTESAQGFADEIQLLRRLKGKPNIIQLIDAEASMLYESPAYFRCRPSRIHALFCLKPGSEHHRC